MISVPYNPIEPDIVTGYIWGSIEMQRGSLIRGFRSQEHKSRNA
jgi:hypothetical protein